MKDTHDSGRGLRQGVHGQRLKVAGQHSGPGLRGAEDAQAAAIFRRTVPRGGRVSKTTGVGRRTVLGCCRASESRARHSCSKGDNDPESPRREGSRALGLPQRRSGRAESLRLP